MFVPSNAIPNGSAPAAKVPRDPHVPEPWVHAARAFLQTPGPRDAMGAMGAMQSGTGGGQALQGPIAQSLLVLHDARHAVPAALQLKLPGHATAVAVQAPLPLQPCVTMWDPEHVSGPQLVPVAGYTHAPDASQSVAPQVASEVEHAAEQQCVPAPDAPQAPLEHWSLAEQAAPAAPLGTHAPPAQ